MLIMTKVIIVLAKIIIYRSTFGHANGLILSQMVTFKLPNLSIHTFKTFPRGTLQQLLSKLHVISVFSYVILF